MTKDHAISRESLGRSDSIRAEQPLKTRQLTLAFQHKPDDCAFDRRLAGLHSSDRSPWGAQRNPDPQTDALPHRAIIYVMSTKGTSDRDSRPAIIERSAEKADIWLKDVAAELGDDDRQYAYRALRAVLHVLRDRLTIDVAAQLAAQLPTLIRGIYYEDWDPSRTPMPPHTADTLLEHVVSEGRFSGETEASTAVTAVMAVLRRRLPPGGEIDAIMGVLPEKLRMP